MLLGIGLEWERVNELQDWRKNFLKVCLFMNNYTGAYTVPH